MTTAAGWIVPALPFSDGVTHGRTLHCICRSSHLSHHHLSKVMLDEATLHEVEFAVAIVLGAGIRLFSWHCS